MTCQKRGKRYRLPLIDIYTEDYLVFEIRMEIDLNKNRQSNILYRYIYPVAAALILWMPSRYTRLRECIF